MFAQAVDNAFDARNVVVLGNNEGNKTLPAVLPEESYAAGEITGFGECCVLGKLPFELRVIRAEIEIVHPFAKEFLLGNIVEDKAAGTCLRDGEAVVEEAPGICGLIIGTYLFPAESLSAVESLVEIEIGF